MPDAPGLDRFGRFVNRREVAALDGRLAAGERVLYALEAYRARKGLLAATDRRVVFLVRRWFGRRMAWWPYAQVRAVRVRLDVDDALLTLVTAGGDVPFAKVGKRAAEAFAKAVRERPPAPGELVRFQDQRTRPRSSKEQRIERLDRLLERGAMTRAEHERARRAALDDDE